jgi:Protein of unknown function (DUF3102)
MSGVKDALGDKLFSAPEAGSLPWLAAQINFDHRAVASASVRVIDHALHCGMLLSTAKSKVPHGKWLDWLAEHCPDVSKRSAQVYMQMADNAEAIQAKSAAAALLTIKGALKLISRQDEPGSPTPECPDPPVELEPQSGLASSTSTGQAAAPLVTYGGADMPDLPPELVWRAAAAPAPASAAPVLSAHSSADDDDDDFLHSEADRADEADASPEHYRSALIIHASQAIDLAEMFYASLKVSPSSVTDEAIDAAIRAARAWSELAANLSGGDAAELRQIRERLYRGAP